jgi:hypothetical protein
LELIFSSLALLILLLLLTNRNFSYLVEEQRLYE